MGKSLNDLQLKDEQLPTAGQTLDDLPQFGQFAPPPQPGPMTFKLPGDLTNLYETFETEKDGKKETRVEMQFDASSPLLIVQSVGNRYNNEPFQTKLNNNERPRGKDKKLASDLDYLIAAIEGPQSTRPATNRAYIEKVRTYGSKLFGGDLRWSWRCGKNRNIRVKDATGNTVEVENQKGCGEAYYQEDVSKGQDGEYPLEIQCKCGAVLRAFGNLDNIRPAVK